MLRYCFLAVTIGLTSSDISAQIVVSGNEGKLDLLGSTTVVEDNPVVDGLTILDFTTFPPSVKQVTGVPNSVLGPPSNLAITPDRTRVLVASSIVIDPAEEVGYRPDNRVRLIDITADPITVSDVVEVGQQPSGMCVSPDGSMALVANRASNTISIIRIENQNLQHIGEVVVCEPGESPTDVDLTPDGQLGLVAVNEGQYIRVLNIDGFNVQSTERKLSVFGKPYRCDISDDGRVAATNGTGTGNGRDANAISIIDLRGDGPKTVQYVATGYGPESCAISPDSSMIAVALINGTNLPPDDPQYRTHGLVSLLARDSDDNFELVQEVKIGRIPEGIIFTPDGRYLVVQCHPDKQLWIFKLKDMRLLDTGKRIHTNAFPSGIDAR